MYVVCASPQEARRIGKALLTLRLVGCIHVQAQPCRSWYWWKGKVEDASETVLFMKALTRKRTQIKRHIEQQHSYECPCILFFTADHAAQNYLTWLSGL